MQIWFYHFNLSCFVKQYMDCLPSKMKLFFFEIAAFASKKNKHALHYIAMSIWVSLFNPGAPNLYSQGSLLEWKEIQTLSTVMLFLVGKESQYAFSRLWSGPNSQIQKELLILANSRADVTHLATPLKDMISAIYAVITLYETCLSHRCPLFFKWQYYFTLFFP